MMSTFFSTLFGLFKEKEAEPLSPMERNRKYKKIALFVILMLEVAALIVCLMKIPVDFPIASMGIIAGIFLLLLTLSAARELYAQ